MAQKKSANSDIFDVARAAGVSISTVSRVLNHPNLVKPDTRKRIEDAIKATGYIRNRAAQMMHGRRSGTIGLVVPTIDHTIFAELIQVFSEAVEEQGFSLILATHGYDLEREYQLLRKLLEHRVDGVALIGFEHLDETYGVLESQNTPAVTMWNYASDTRIPCVGASNISAGAMAAEHLMDLGHKEIALIISSAGGNDRAADRLHGARKAMKNRGITPIAEVSTQYSVSAAKRDCLSVLETQKPTAILCGNDVIGIGAMYAAARIGLSVPKDVSIMGIGDFKGSDETEPALSTVRLPAREIGQRAAKTLGRLIAGQTDVPATWQCDVRLLPRGSTAKHEL